MLVCRWPLAGLWLGLRLAGPIGAQPADEPLLIEEVSIEGLKTYLPEQILPRLQTRPGGPYNPITVGEDLTELGKIMRTATIRADPTEAGGLIVRFQVTEFPRLRRLQVVGNQKLKLKRIEHLADMEPGDLVDEKTRNALRRSLRNEYKALGMPQASVTINLIDVEAEDEEAPPLADVQIVIDEGLQVLVDKVRIEGNEAFSNFRLRRLIATKGSLGIIKNYYDEQTFEEDLDLIRDLYAGYGYFDAVVERGGFEQREGRKAPVVSPLIVITEGERYRFGAARVRGARLFSRKELLDPFEPLAGDEFDARKFGRALGRLRDLYVNHGLLTTEIRPEYEYDAENRVLNMLIEVTERDRIYVNRIKLAQPPLEDEDEKSWFRGLYDKMSPPIGEEPVLREVLLKPGDIYNKELERRSMRRLARMGVFEQGSVQIYNEPTGEPGLHDMVIKLRQSVTGAITGGIGFGDASGAFLYASFAERNLGGRADVFQTRIRVGTREAAASISYLDRHAGQTRDTMAYRLYYQTLRRQGYRAAIPGVNVEWGHPLEGDWTRYLSGRVEFVDLRERSGFEDAEEDLDRNYGVGTVRLRFDEDTRWPLDQRPREGYLQSFGIEAGFAGGALIKLEAGRDQYWRIPWAERLTYRLTATAAMMPYDSDIVPIHERYFMGGSTDMRGYRFRGAGYFDDEEDDLPIGGAAKLLVKNELIFPIAGPVSGVVFTDVGLLGRRPTSWQTPRLSTGVGVRFDMRRAQVGIDLAAPLITGDSDDQTRLFHFSFQSAF